jgi:endonuclease-8
MPEGPEVRREADRLARVLVGKPLARVWFGLDRLAPYAGALEAAGVRAVDARGKAFLLRFGPDATLYVHHQLYGRWTFGRGGRVPESTRSLRAALWAADDVGEPGAGALLWSATDVHLLDDVALAAHPYLVKLGPDALDPTLTAEAVAERLGSRAFRGRSLAALYLDQSFVAGIGNYLRTEILHVAGLLPERRAKDLSAEERLALAGATVAVTRQSYATGGITNDLDRVAALKAEGLPRGRYRHHVFARGGRPCWTCGAEIARVELAGRRVYVCEGCQR